MARALQLLPGYLDSRATPSRRSRTGRRTTGPSGAKFLVELLKAWFGENATAENDFGYAWLPKKSAEKNYTIFRIFETALAGKHEAALRHRAEPDGHEPEPQAACTRRWRKLDMLVVARAVHDRDRLLLGAARRRSEDASRPRCCSCPPRRLMEKDGTITNSGRMVQWRYAARRAAGGGQGRSGDHRRRLPARARSVRGLDRGEGRPSSSRPPGATRSRRTMCGVTVAAGDRRTTNLKTGEPVKGIGELQADGSTSSGCWIYAGVYGGEQEPDASGATGRPIPSGLGIYPGFAWTWPGNMHVLYNRASCDADGQAVRREEHADLVGRDAGEVDGVRHARRPARDRRTEDAEWPEAVPHGRRGRGPALRRAVQGSRSEGAKSCRATPRTRRSTDRCRSSTSRWRARRRISCTRRWRSNPCLKYPRLKGKQPIGATGEFPYVLSTSSIAEHWCAGTVTRNIPWLNELVPEPIVELPEAARAAAHHPLRRQGPGLVGARRGGGEGGGHRPHAVAADQRQGRAHRLDRTTGIQRPEQGRART